MNESTYKNAIAFLNRVDLKGAEVNAMVDVMNAITSVYEDSKAKKEAPKLVEKNAKEG